MPSLPFSHTTAAVIFVDFSSKLKEVQNNVNAACKKAGRNSGEVKILAATKDRTVEEIKEVAVLGISLCGENYLQEAEEKISSLPEIEWHFIGHLQSNKAKKAVQLFDCIQSVDSIKLAKKIDASAEKHFPVFIEINIGEEKSKHGVSPTQLPSFFQSLKQFKNLDVKGLMCMAPFVEAEQTRGCFQKMKQLATQLGLKELSMGMSNDYSTAVEEGSTMVRLGTALFGER